LQGQTNDTYMGRFACQRHWHSGRRPGLGYLTIEYWRSASLYTFDRVIKHCWLKHVLFVSECFWLEVHHSNATAEVHGNKSHGCRPSSEATRAWPAEGSSLRGMCMSLTDLTPQEGNILPENCSWHLGWCVVWQHDQSTCLCLMSETFERLLC
jgi:hypothetical protein